MAVPWHIRVSRFLDRNPWVTDTVLFALPLTLIMLVTVPIDTSAALSVETFNLQLVSLAVMCLVLSVRRMFPVVTAWIVTAAGLVFALFGAWPSIALVAVPLAVYSVTAYGSAMWGRFFLVVGLVASLIFVVSAGLTLIVAGGTPEGLLDLEVVVVVAVVVGFCAAAVALGWTLGDIRNRRQRDIAQITERNALLERERENEIRMATDAERMRIAREMHDVIAHSMSVMIAQADGGRYIATSNPLAAATALDTIAQTGREALNNMRQMLGVLRTQENTALTAPMPGLGDLGDLFANVRATGLEVTAQVSNELPPLGPAAGLALYRIVQEALTNVMKHGGPGARAYVTVERRDTQVVAEVVSTGRSPAPTSPGAGMGIQGMKERAHIHGGTLVAHATDSGFVVIATLPGEDVGGEVGREMELGR